MILALRRKSKSLQSFLQKGQSMTEFIIVLPVMLILILGGFQVALIYQAKTTLNYAAFLAARTGAVTNGHIGLMENALARGMAPLYTHCDESEEVQRARDYVRQEITAGFARIDIINPPTTAFSDSTSYSSAGDKFIPNDNLMYRVTNVGSSSGLSIQDANLLKIRVTYCYPMYVPYIDRILTRIMTQAADPDNCPECLNVYPTGGGTFENGCFLNDRFPINAQAIVRMQSDSSLEARNRLTSGLYQAPAVANVVLPASPSVCP
jgi:TadE-like protein